MLNFLAIFLVIAGTVVGAFGSLYMKKGAKNFDMNLLKQLRNKELILGLALFVISAPFYIYGLSLERLSILYPITSLTYIWVAFLSLKFLGEKMNWQKWCGIFLIVLGIFFIAYFAA
jgi:drug/metabolite transporter (DMT)-like permease